MSVATSNRPVAPTPPAPDSAPPPNGHGPDGRFAKGNPGGHGNPFARRTAALREAFVRALTPRRMTAFGRALLKRGTEGDNAASRLVLAYGIGRAAPAPDPDTLDRHEVSTFAAAAQMLLEIQAAMQAPTPSMLASFAREVLPVTGAAVARRIAGHEPFPTPAKSVDDEIEELLEGDRPCDDADEDDSDEADEPGDDGGAAPAEAARPAKSPQGTGGSPSGTSRPAPARPANGDRPCHAAPNGGRPTVTRRHGSAPPPSTGSGQTAGPGHRPQKPNGRNGPPNSAR